MIQRTGISERLGSLLLAVIFLTFLACYISIVPGNSWSSADKQLTIRPGPASELIVMEGTNIGSLVNTFVKTYSFVVAPDTRSFDQLFVSISAQDSLWVNNYSRNAFYILVSIHAP